MLRTDQYVFDPQAYLRRHLAETGGAFGFLVDEAHNLVERARDMFSAELQAGELRDVRRAINTAVPRCAKALSKLHSAIRKLGGTEAAALETTSTDGSRLELDLFSPSATLPAPRNLAVASPSAVPALQARQGISLFKELPAALVPLLEEALKSAEVWLVKNEPEVFREDLLGLYFRLHSFLRTCKQYDEHYATLVETGPGARVRLFCLDPSPLLGQALERGKAAVFFSATLGPMDYYRNLLGGRPEDPVMQLPSPFPPENLAVLVHDRIRTELKARANTLAEVAQAIGALVAERPGHYLVYLPSYQYLQTVREQFQAHCPTVPTLSQRPGMTEAERETFLAAFAATPEHTLVGFAVMGGIFGEGIDLWGERLIGAIIVGVGLPQLSLERDLIRDYFEQHQRAGFDYAYAFPGMNRVLQAAGRVIRSETDRGVVLLIDTRFAQARYRQLLPSWWRPLRAGGADKIRQAARQFWGGYRAGE